MFYLLTYLLTYYLHAVTVRYIHCLVLWNKTNVYFLLYLPK